METNLLAPLILQLEKSGETRDIALARVLDCSNNLSLSMKKIENRLAKVEEQTTKTNGRVTTIETDLEDLEKKQTEDYIKLHSPLALPIIELQKSVTDIKAFIDFKNKVMISAISIFSTLFVVFGVAWWNKIYFLLGLDYEMIEHIVLEIINKVGN